MFPVQHKVVMYASKVDKQEASMADYRSLIKHVLILQSTTIQSGSTQELLLTTHWADVTLTGLPAKIKDTDSSSDK